MFKIYHCKYIEYFSNNHLKKLICFFFISFFALTGFSQRQSARFLAYIDRYKAIAMRHAQEYKIPAAITLAQGLLESGAGTSALATGSNNHFGIKCHNWTGEKTYVNGRQTAYYCYRKYDKAEESYEDHAKFLQQGRYSRLYNYPITDYKNWAKGLKACGYAEGPSYAQALIRLIETYKLNELDEKVASGAFISDRKVATLKKDKEDYEDEIDHEIVEKEMKETVRKVFFKHNQHKKWNLYYVYATKDDTYESIALEFSLTTKNLLEYNDITDKKARPREGDVVWVDKKLPKSPGNVSSYTVKKGDTPWKVSQMWGIRLKNLCKLNKIDPDSELTVGQELKLQ